MRLRFPFSIALAYLPIFLVFPEVGRGQTAPTVWILVNDLPGADKEIGKSILTTIAEKEAYEARVCSPREIPFFLAKGEIRSRDTLVLTDCGSLPVEAARPLDNFVEGGGRL